MNCKKCGAPLTEGDVFCKNCGEPVNKPQLERTNEENSPSIDPASVNPTSVDSASVNPTSVDSAAVNPASMDPASVNPTPVNPTPVNPTPVNSASMNNGTPVAPQPKKNKMVIYIIIAVVLIAAATFGGICLGKKSKTKDNDTPIAANTKNTYKVKLDNYTLKIPNDIIHEYNYDGSLIIGDEDVSWAVMLSILDITYSVIKNNETMLKTNLEYTYGSPVNIQEKEINGVNFIIFEVEINGEKCLLAFSQLDISHVMTSIIGTEEDEYGYKILKKVTPIIKSAEYTPNSNNMLPSTDLNISDLIDEINQE